MNINAPMMTVMT